MIKSIIANNNYLIQNIALITKIKVIHKGVIKKKRLQRIFVSNN